MTSQKLHDAWELLHPADYDTDVRTDRMRVPGGWLYRVTERFENGATTMAFVPDPRAVEGKDAA